MNSFEQFNTVYALWYKKKHIHSHKMCKNQWKRHIWHFIFSILYSILYYYVLKLGASIKCQKFCEKKNVKKTCCGLQTPLPCGNKVKKKIYLEIHVKHQNFARNARKCGENAHITTNSSYKWTFLAVLFYIFSSSVPSKCIQ